MKLWTPKIMLTSAISSLTTSEWNRLSKYFRAYLLACDKAYHRVITKGNISLPMAAWVARFKILSYTCL